MTQFRVTLLLDVVDLSDEQLSTLLTFRASLEPWQMVDGMNGILLGRLIAEAIKCQAGNDLIFEGEDYFVEITEAKCECVERLL